MKVLHVNSSDSRGGAARAVLRLHQALLSQAIDSQVLVQYKTKGDEAILAPQSKWAKFFNPMRPAIDQLPIKRYKDRGNGFFSSFWFPVSDIVRMINQIAPDIVHLHWVAEGMLPIDDLLKINAPIVWSLHDMWAFTGGCHYDEGCGKYQQNCGACPVLGSWRENDLSSRILLKKKRVFAKIANMTIVGVSRWMTQCSQESQLFSGHPNITLANPIDTKVFRPIHAEFARELWGLPKNKKLILFGAISAVDDPRKGFRQLIEALHLLDLADIELVVFGSDKPKSVNVLGCRTHYLGHIHDDVSLVALYNAVDVIVIPSLQEAFGQTATEAMACGTPVVAFAATGLLDIVDHQVNGYLANPYDASDLAKGIAWVLNEYDYQVIAMNAREKVLNEFEGGVVAKKYISLYQELLNR